jgi:hypothetical protein
LLTSLVTTLVLFAQAGVISGRVVDARSGEPVAGANVVVVGTRLGASAATGGGFVIGRLQPGRYQLVASHIAYEPETALVEIFADQVIRPQLNLRPKTIPMPEVRSQSVRREIEEKVTVREITAERLTRQAGSFVQDPMRALSFLPGVAPSARGEWSGAYVVRGGDPDEGSLWFGDVELLWPYHLLGFSSVINPDLVEKISFYPSVFPVRYGDALSSVAVLTPREADRGGGFWAYDPMNVKAAYVGNLADIGFLGSARRTYYNVLFGPMGAGTGNRPSYSDVTGQVTLPVGASSRLRVTAVSGTDHILSTLRGTETEMTESGLSLGAGLESRLGPARADVTFRYAAHDFNITPAVWWGSARSREEDYGLGARVSGPLGTRLGYELGLDLARQDYVGNLMTRADLQRVDNSAAFYAALALRPLDRVELDLGVRLEDVRWAADRVAQPRAVLSWQPVAGAVVRAGYRRHYQHSYSFLRNSCAAFVFDQEYDSYQLFASDALGAKRADHFSIGGEFRPTSSNRVTIEGYHKEYAQLATWRADLQGNLESVANAGAGSARGLELTVEQDPVGGWSGWLTYALGFVRKQQGTDTANYWDKSDRRHALGLSLQRALPGDWTLTATFNLNTGVPYTPLLYTQSPQDVSGSDLNRGTSRYVIVGEKNSARVPTYHRLDLKVTKELPNLPLRPHVYIEILNIYNQQNAYNIIQFEDRDGRIVTGQSTGIPFIPLIGIGGRF